MPSFDYSVNEVEYIVNIANLATAYGLNLTNTPLVRAELSSGSTPDLHIVVQAAE